MKEDMVNININAVDIPPYTVAHTVREARGKVSQDMLGAMCGVDQSTISRIESGDISDPAYSTVYNTLYACGYKLIAIPVRAEYKI